MKIFKSLKSFLKKNYHKRIKSDLKITSNTSNSRKLKLINLSIDNFKNKIVLFLSNNKIESFGEATKKIAIKEYILINHSEENLLISEILESTKLVKVRKIFDINLPNSVISGNKVIDLKALSDILKNIFVLINKSINKPVLLNLDSSLFVMKSFTSNNETQEITDKDPQLIASSPYINENTLAIFKSINKKSANVLYTNKEIIDSWLNLLKNLDRPIIGISNTFVQLVDKISLTYKNPQNFIVADVGLTSSTIFLHSNTGEISSSKLPFGTELYNSSNEDLRIQFFKRFQSSINLYLKEKGSINDYEIFLGGIGLHIVEKDIRKFSKNMSLINEKLNSRIYFIESQDATKEKGKNKYNYQIFPLDVENIKYNSLEKFTSFKRYQFQKENKKYKIILKIKKIPKKLKNFFNIIKKNKFSFYPVSFVLLLSSIIWIITIPSVITINKLKNDHIKFKEATHKLKINTALINQEIKNVVELSSIYRNQAPVFLFSKLLQESILPNETKLNGYLVNNNGFNIELISKDIESINKVIKLLENNPIIDEKSLSIEIIRSLNNGNEFNNKILLKLNGKLKNLTLKDRLKYSKKYENNGLYSKLKTFSKINNLFN